MILGTRAQCMHHLLAIESSTCSQDVRRNGSGKVLREMPELLKKFLLQQKMRRIEKKIRIMISREATVGGKCEARKLRAVDGGRIPIVHGRECTITSIESIVFPQVCARLVQVSDAPDW